MIVYVPVVGRISGTSRYKLVLLHAFPVMSRAPPGAMTVPEKALHPVNVELLSNKLTRCPAVPSNNINPILLAVLIVTVLVPPSVMRPVKTTSVAWKGGGGTKKSAALVAVPTRVEMLM